MPDTSGIRDFPLKAVFLIHLVLFCLSTLGVWAPPGYIFYNYVMLGLLLWTIVQRESPDAIQFAFCVNALSIPLDIFAIALCFPHSDGTAARFAVAFAILHLVVRPFSAIYMMQVVRDRTGNPGLMSNLFPPGQSSSNYEDLDRTATNPPQAGYDFPGAQQI